MKNARNGIDRIIKDIIKVIIGFNKNVSPQLAYGRPGIWKKNCVRNRDKVFEKLSALIDRINEEVLGYQGIKFEKREIYAEPHGNKPRYH